MSVLEGGRYTLPRFLPGDISRIRY